MAIGTTATAAGIVEANVKLLGNTTADTPVYSSSQVDTIVDHIAEKVTQVMTYKGIVQIPVGHESDADGGVASALATIVSPAHGDLYNVGGNLNNDNYVWNDTAKNWDKMASSFSLPGYLADNALESKYLQLANAGSLATKSEVAEADLASALAAKINGKAEQSALTALESTVGDANSGLVKDVADLKAIGVQANVLEGVQFKGSGASSFSDLVIDSNKKVQIDLSTYALSSEITIDTIQVKHNGSNEYVALSPESGTKTVKLDLSSYLKAADISYPVTDVQLKGSGDASFVTIMDGTVAKIDLSGCFSKTAGDLATYRIAQIAATVKKDRATISLYDVYDMVAAVIDAAAATQA